MPPPHADPELMQGMQNPKVMGALQSMMANMGNPAALGELLKDPEVDRMIVLFILTSCLFSG